jgi:hypothetical protein
MQKTKKANTAFIMLPAAVSQAEQVLLSHVEMCYSVALALTRNPILGQRLARATLLWAWQNQAAAGELGRGDVKMALLRELRSRFLKEYHPACSPGAGQTDSVAFAGKAEEALCAAEITGHAEARIAG